MDPYNSPETLQNKVQWDIRFYFARCANENIDKFTKFTFELKTHANTGNKYIAKVYDEQTKNHQIEQENITTACMPQIPGNKLCPVETFLKYLSHLSPMCEDLWQQPKTLEESKKSNIWYKNRKIGPNPLASFMSRMSHEADLSRVYTNHSICVTGSTYLLRNQYSAKQVMSITGHKSLNSLSIYQKVSTDEKLAMGYAMSVYIQSDKLQNPMQKTVLNEAPINVLAVQQNPDENQQIQENPPQPMNQLQVYESEDPFQDAEIPDFDLGVIMDTIEKETSLSQMHMTGMTTSIMQQHQITKQSPSVPIFNNCKIGNITININKN